MAANITGLFPSVTNSIVNKVLFLEIYFLLKTGQSPAYFSLVDFVSNYSIDLFYIVVFFFMLSGWIMIPALAFYYFLPGALSWLGRQMMDLIKIEGIPIFKALRQDEREKSVSLEVANDYAKYNHDTELKARIDEYEKSAKERLEGEALAAANFVLVVLIAWISHATGAPNFLMKIASFADSFLNGAAYEVCFALLVFQGSLGRATNFHLLFASGNLPPSFFFNEEEREKVEAWVKEIVARQGPLASQWMRNSRLR
jgi:hypothetical protein